MKKEIFFHSNHLKHDRPGHPETAQRLAAIGIHINDWADELQYNLVKRSEQANNETIRLVHGDAHTKQLSIMEKYGSGNIDGDTYFCPDSLTIAKQGLGGLLELGNKLLAGDLDRGFAITRPPGHHATPSQSMGFCLFSNVAILCRHLLSKEPDLRIAIYDFDVHHGNGTEDCLIGVENTLFISTHQEFIYPGSGSLGLNKNIVNLPLPEGTNDGEYDLVLDNVVLPAIKKFAPDIIVLSAGYDAHVNDPLANLGLSSEYFGKICSKLVATGKGLNIKGIIAALEGGYNLSALPESVKCSLDALAEAYPGKYDNVGAKDSVRQIFDSRIADFKNTYKTFL